MRKASLYHRKHCCALLLLLLILPMVLVSCKNTDTIQNTYVNAKTQEPPASVNPTNSQNTTTAEKSDGSTTEPSKDKPTPTIKPANTATKPNTPSETKPVTKPSPRPQVQPKTAEQYVDTLTLEQQVAQMFFARCPDSGAVEQIKQYSPEDIFFLQEILKTKPLPALRKQYKTIKTLRRYPC